jgi:hypothetical protein
MSEDRIDAPDDASGSAIDPELAARLTLFFLRGQVPSRTMVRDDAFAFARGAEPVSTYLAMRRLVESEKPLVCWGEVDGGVLVVQTRLPGSLRSLHAPGMTGQFATFFAHVDREQHGDGWRELKALCLGRSEWLVVTLGELDAWGHEYRIAGRFGWSGGRLDQLDEEALARHDVPPEALADALSQGAVELRDYHAARTGVEPEVHVAITRIEPGQRPSLLCEQCGEREARYTVEWLEDEHPPRHFCQRCIDDDEVVDFEFDAGRDMERERIDLSITELSGTPAELAARAEELAFTWAMRDPPPFVRDFIDRYRAPDDPSIPDTAP